MKNIILLLIILSCFSICTITYAQTRAKNRSAYQDSKTLADLLTNKNKSTEDSLLVNNILINYFKNQSEVTDFFESFRTLKTSGFELSFLGIEKARKSSDLIYAMNGFSGSIITNPTIGIDALGSFIASRFKQEINIAFLQKFKEDFNTLPYLSTFFPSSRMIMLNSDPYNYPIFMETLRQAFEDDLANLPKHLADTISNNKEFAIPSVLISYLLNVKTMNDIISTTNNLANENITNTNIKNALIGIALMMNSVKSNGKNVFISTEEINSLIENEDHRNLYFTFFIRQNEGYLKGLNLDVNSLISAIKQVIPIYNDIKQQIDVIQTAVTKNQLSPKLVQQSIDILIISNIRIVEVYKSVIDSKTDINDLINILRTTSKLNDLTGLIIEKKYGLALFKSVEFVDSIAISGNKLTELQKAKLLRYTNFVTNCLTAQTSADAMKALETAANPVGSYRVKRNSTFNISLNSYAGGFLGVNKSFEKNNFLFGFTAPVGLYFGWGNLSKKKCSISNKLDNGSSFGFFFPLVDVGAVTAFRIKDSKTELADVSWSNVWSPGAFITYGFKKIPISLNLGGQMGPELSSIDNNGKPTFFEKEFYVRASVVIDIPIFDFFTSKREYKLNQ